MTSTGSWVSRKTWLTGRHAQYALVAAQHVAVHSPLNNIPMVTFYRSPLALEIADLWGFLEVRLHDV